VSGNGDVFDFSRIAFAHERDVEGFQNLCAVFFLLVSDRWSLITDYRKLRTDLFRRSKKQMPVTIEIPTAFRRFTEGAPKVDCSAATVAEALNELTSRFPDLSRHVRDETGQIRQFLNVYLNEEDIRFLGGESCALKEGDRVLLVPSIAGGSTCQDRV